MHQHRGALEHDPLALLNLGLSLCFVLRASYLQGVCAGIVVVVSFDFHHFVKQPRLIAQFMLAWWWLRLA